MKCELCHNAEAQTVITRMNGAAEEELYVCKVCANAEHQRQHRKRQRTRKISGLPPGISMSVTEISGNADMDGEAPPFLGAIMNALKGIVSDVEKTCRSKSGEEGKRYHNFPLSRVESEFRIGNRLHLEGLHIIGELDAVKRALHALDMKLIGIDVDGVEDAGHTYKLNYGSNLEQAKRVVSDILKAERNARHLIVHDSPRVFCDAVCRALALLKNCRLLSPGELYDMLSPIRLAAHERMLDGIEADDVEQMLMDIDLSSNEDTLEADEHMRVDAERADILNHRFEDVTLNERAEGMLS